MTEAALDAEDLGESFMRGSLRTRLFAQGLKGNLAEETGELNEEMFE